MAVHKTPRAWTRDWEKVLEPQDAVESVKGRITGSLPRWLAGRITRIGPRHPRPGDTHCRHSDTMSILHQFHIADGHVTYRSRFLQSDSFRKSATPNRIVVTEFGPAVYPDPCATLFKRFENTFSTTTPKRMTGSCHVSGLQEEDEMLALNENCRLRKVDPERIDTIGNEVMLNKYVAVNLATSHPHVEEDGTVYNLGSSFTTDKGPSYNVIQIPGGSLERAKIVASVSCQWRLYPCYYHSFAMTDHYWIFVEQPLVMSARNIMTGAIANRPPFEAMKWLPDKKVKFRIIERDTGNLVRSQYTADAFVTFHHVNAFEANGHLVLDLCATDDGEIVKALCVSNILKNSGSDTRHLFRSCLRRYVLPTTGLSRASLGENLVRLEGTACRATRLRDGTIHCTFQTLCSKFFEMPGINYNKNGKPYRYAYGLSTKGNDLVFERLIKVDVITGQTWEFADESHTMTEPIFIAAPNAVMEDDGMILSTLLHKDDPHYVALLVLNARNMLEAVRAEFSVDEVAASIFCGHFVGSHEESYTY